MSQTESLGVPHTCSSCGRPRLSQSPGTPASPLAPDAHASRPGPRHTLLVPPSKPPAPPSLGRRERLQKSPRARLPFLPLLPFSLLSSDTWRAPLKTRVRPHPSLAPHPAEARFTQSKSHCLYDDPQALLMRPHCHSDSSPTILPHVSSALATQVALWDLEHTRQVPNSGRLHALLLLPSVLSHQEPHGLPSYRL